MQARPDSRGHGFPLAGLFLQALAHGFTTPFRRRLLWGFAALSLIALPALGGSWPAARDPRVHATSFPEWTFSMRIWPFDILTPAMSNDEIDQRLDEAQSQEAQVVLVYLEEEHMYGSFVDEEGFEAILARLGHLTAGALGRGLRTIVYVNGLEVMTRGAFDASCTSTGIATMATLHGDWLQRDLEGESIVYRCQDQAWLEPDWEDAWLSPYSGYRSFFQQRLVSLAGAGVDGVYIDAVFLPGYQSDEENRRWGSTDPAFAAELLAKTGELPPADDDPTSEAFRAFLSFRHEAVADYLSDLALTAWQEGVVPFWESSTNDTVEGTLLGNATAVTGRQGLGFSPEIEPEGDWLAAFRMAKAARELNQERPMIYLAWPETASESGLHAAIAVAQSGSWYPTADSPPTPETWSWMQSHGDWLAQRVPFGGDVALVYSVRNQDFTLETESFSDRYAEAFESLVEAHVPFRIATLEYLLEDGLEGVSTVVLPGLEGISNDEASLLASRTVVTLGQVGTRDEEWSSRAEPLTFPDTIDLEAVRGSLPFELQAPAGSWIEYYGDREGRKSMTLFVVSPDPGGEIQITAEGSMSLSVAASRFGESDRTSSGREHHVPIDAPFIALRIVEEGSETTPCVADAETLCLQDERFEVKARWRTAYGASGTGEVIPLTSNTGLFWFFSASNIEMVTKVLDACGVNQRFWVFAGGLTDVEVDLTVRDTVSEQIRTYHNPLGAPLQPIQDTDAFPDCP